LHYFVLICVDNFLNGVKIGVMYNIEITHLSVGQTNDKWESHRQKFIKEYSDKLPLTAEHTLIVPDITRKYKKSYKVSIVILHKDKNELLFGCIDSIKNKTTHDNYDIIVGDTGSSQDKLDEIKQG
jgi:hypothetical protein